MRGLKREDVFPYFAASGFIHKSSLLELKEAKHFEWEAYFLPLSFFHPLIGQERNGGNEIIY